MFQPTHPGLHVDRVRVVPPQPTRIDVAGFIGLAERGPLHDVRVIEGWPEFVATFGDFQDRAFLAFTVRAFFENGGRRCHVLRIAAPAVETVTTGVQPADGSALVLAETEGLRAGALATLVQTSASATSGVQPADRRSSIMVNVAGFRPGQMATLQQDGRRPVRLEIVEVEPAVQGLVWGQPIPGTFDITLPILITATSRDERLVREVVGNTVTWAYPLDARFDLEAPIHAGFGAGSAGGVLHDETGDPLLAVEAANAGRWGNAVSVKPSTAVSAAYVTRRRATPDPANRLSLDRLDGLAAGSFVEVSQDGASPHRSLIDAIEHDARAVVLRDPMVGFDLVGAADGTRPVTLSRFAFGFSVFEKGRLVEIFEDLNLPHPDRPDESLVNSLSDRIRITRLHGTEANWLDATSPMLEAGHLVLGGGRDGTAMLTAQDVTGTAGEPPTGLALFETATEPAALAVPDIHLPEMPPVERVPDDPEDPDPCALCPGPMPAPLPAIGVIQEATPGFDPATVQYIQTTLVEHCERQGDRVALLDPPVGPDQDCLDWPDLLRWRQEFSSSYAACYFPWIDVADPKDRIGRKLRRIPPSGHALGQFARADADPGRAAPANRPLSWASQLGCQVDDTMHGIMNERGINVIRPWAGRGLRIMGARTLSPDTNLNQLVVRRLLIRLKRAMRRELAWAVFEPANTAFENSVIATLEGLLELEWQAGRLRGGRREDAFRVIVDREASNPDNGEFVVAIAIAPSLPAEFVLLRLSFTFDAMDLAELSASGGWPE